MIAIETERLALHEFTDDDAAFVLRLVNEPSFLRYIGDRGVRTIEDARRYIADGPVAGYARYGYGLLRVARKADGTTVGMCGVLKRDTLPDPDIGFSFLPEFWSQGYALESAGAVMKHAREVLRLGRILAITTEGQRALDAPARQAGIPLRPHDPVRQRGAAPVRVRTMKRCAWARSPAMIEYHDREWGVPVHDDRVLFEFITLEGAQAGLSWETILNKRDAYRRAFADFDPARVARFSAARRAKLMRDAGIVRNRLKIESTVTNAAAFLKVQREFGSFDRFLWEFVGGAPHDNRLGPRKRFRPARRFLMHSARS